MPTRLVNWLWEGRIAFGQLNAIVGDPGLGKTTVALDLAARVSRGWDMPVGSLGTSIPQDVLVLSAEDDAAITIVPRLKAAGADLDRIDIVAVA